VHDAVGRVVEHLSDHFPANSSVRASLHFHQRGDRVLIDKEMIDCPAITAVLFRRNTAFPGD
jgi:hypothetical protein